MKRYKKTTTSERPKIIWKITALSIVGWPSDCAHGSLCAEPTCPECMAGSSGAITAPQHQTRDQTVGWHLRSLKSTLRAARRTCTFTRAGTWRTTTRTRSTSSWILWWSELRRSTNLWGSPAGDVLHTLPEWCSVCWGYRVHLDLFSLNSTINIILYRHISGFSCIFNEIHWGQINAFKISLIIPLC